MFFHPATRIVTWVSVVALSQLARGPVLWGFGLFVLLASLWFAPVKSRLLLRRVRVLIFVLVILFAFFTPGEAMLPWVGQAGPTWEGAALAAQHCLRLGIVVMLVAVLLERTSERAMVSGLMTLAAPLTMFGLSVERLAVRVLLVFRYVESPLDGGWRALLAEDQVDGPIDPILVMHAALRWPDWLAMAGLATAVVWGASL